MVINDRRHSTIVQRWVCLQPSANGNHRLLTGWLLYVEKGCVWAVMQLMVLDCHLCGFMHSPCQGEAQLAELFPMLACLNWACRRQPLFRAPLLYQTREPMCLEIPSSPWHHNLEMLYLTTSWWATLCVVSYAHTHI